LAYTLQEARLPFSYSFHAVAEAEDVENMPVDIFQ
jgi:hypothetical protein